MTEERVLLPGGGVFELKFSDQMHYSLGFRRNQKLLVEYKSNGKQYRKTLRGRESDYTFKSVEQLRYDFERDAEDAQRQD